MGENNSGFFSSNGSLWVSSNLSTSNLSARNYTIATNYTSGYNFDEKITKMEKEIKDLRKIIARLSTMVCTHIGQEQLKNFNNEQ